MLADMYRETGEISIAGTEGGDRDRLDEEGAQALTRRNARYVVSQEVYDDDLRLIRAITHEDYELLMQRMQIFHPNRYERIRNLVVNNRDIRALYLALPNHEPEGQNQYRFFNYIMSQAFELMYITEHGLVDQERELDEAEREFLEAMGPILRPGGDERENFFKYFFDIRERTRIVRLIQEEGVIQNRKRQPKQIHRVTKLGGQDGDVKDRALSDQAMPKIFNGLIYDELISQEINQDISRAVQQIRDEIRIRGLKRFKQVEPLETNHAYLNVYEFLPGIRLIEKPVKDQKLPIIQKLIGMERPGIPPIFTITGRKELYELDLRPYGYVQLVSMGEDFLKENRSRIIKAVEDTFRHDSQNWFFHGHLHWKNILVKVNHLGILEDIKFIDFKHITEITAEERELMIQIANGDPVHVMEGRKRTKRVPFEWWDLREKRFDGLDLDYWGFYNCDLTGSTFIGASLEYAYLIQANLRDVKFTDANLMNVEFKGADVKGVNFEGITTQTSVLFQMRNIFRALPNRNPKAIYYDAKDEGSKPIALKIMKKIFSGAELAKMDKDDVDHGITEEERDFLKKWESFLKDSTEDFSSDPTIRLDDVKHVLFFYPRPFKIGGTKTYQRNVMQSLFKANKDLTIELIYFTSGNEIRRTSIEDPKKNNRLILRGIPIQIVDNVPIDKQDIVDMVEKEINLVQEQNKIDLISLNSSTPEAYILTKILSLANQLQVSTHYFFHGGVITETTKFLIEHADVAVTNSKFYQKVFHDLGLNKVKVHYPVVDMQESLDVNSEAVQSIKERYGLLGRKVILHPGRITTKKGQEMTILAAGQLLKEHPELSSQLAVVIVGPEGNPNGKDRLLLKRLAREWGIDVLFVEGQSQEEMINWYDASYVVIYPTLSTEPFGLVPVEAQARGIPVIAANGGGLKETLKDGITGYLTEQGNYVDLAHKLYDLIIDENKRNEMGEAGKQHVQEIFSAKRSLRNIKSHYSEALNARDIKNKNDVSDIRRLTPKSEDGDAVLSDVYYKQAPIKGEEGVIKESVFDAPSIYEPGDSEIVRHWKRVWLKVLIQSKKKWVRSDYFTSSFNDSEVVPIAFDPLLIPIRRVGKAYDRILLSSSLRKGSSSVSRDDPRALENNIFPLVNDPSRKIFDDPYDTDFVVIANTYPKVEFDSLIFSKQWQEQRLTPQAVKLQINWVRKENVVTDFHRRLAFVPHLHIHLNAAETVPITRVANTFHCDESFRNVEIGKLDYSLAHIALRSGDEEALKEATIFFADHFEAKNYLFTQTMLLDPETNEPIVVLIIYRKGIKLINFSPIGFIKLSNIADEKLLNNFEDQALDEDELHKIRNHIWRNWQENSDFYLGDETKSILLIGDTVDHQDLRIQLDRGRVRTEERRDIREGL